MSTALEKKGPTLRDLLVKAQPKMTGVLPKHLTADRLTQIALIATSKSPLLMECTPTSILQAVMHAAQLGLEAGSVLGHAYLVPYGKEAQLIVGYRGLVELVLRSGKVRKIEARTVHAEDAFVVRLGTDPRIEHEPELYDRGDMIAAYAVATFPDGSFQFEVMTRAEIDAIKGRSRASGKGPWVTDYEEMAKKTVIRRLCKTLPMSTEVATALELEDRAETGEAQGVSDIIDVEGVTSTRASSTDKLRARLGSETETPPPAEERQPGAEG